MYSSSWRVDTDAQWMSIIEGVRRRKPFQSVAGTQSMFYEYTRHFSSIFRNTVSEEQETVTQHPEGQGYELLC